MHKCLGFDIEQSFCLWQRTHVICQRSNLFSCVTTDANGQHAHCSIAAGHQQWICIRPPASPGSTQSQITEAEPSSLPYPATHLFLYAGPGSTLTTLFSSKSKPISDRVLGAVPKLISFISFQKYKNAWSSALDVLPRVPWFWRPQVSLKGKFPSVSSPKLPAESNKTLHNLDTISEV